MGQDAIDDSQRITIEDFVSIHKLVAFCDTFIPADAEGPDVEVFNDARLRKYFQAYPRNIGDPLITYLDMLGKNGYKMRTSMQGEPALFVHRKTEAHQKLLLDEAFGEAD